MTPVVYRVYDQRGSLLYIGSTSEINSRMAVHMATHASPIAFAMQMCADRWETEEHPDMASARKAEKAAIEAEMPFLNRQHNPRRWRRIRGEWVSLLPEYELAWRKAS